jgi:transcription elongation GreA/GreB family factor
MGIIDEQTPLAQALLDHSPGEVVELEAPDQKNRRLRVLKVQHQGELSA